MHARALRRDRAARSGAVLFAHERAFADVLERLELVRRRFSSALLIGTPDPSWPDRLREAAQSVAAADPGGRFAEAARGVKIVEDALDLEPGSFDLCIAIATLDTVNDLPAALLRLRFVLKPDSLLIGVMPGGQTLPRLRQAMRAADAVSGVAAPRVHPRVQPAALAQSLAEAGFAMPVVDVERMQVRYSGLDGLVADLRGMGATNVLGARSRVPLTRAAVEAARREFLSGAVGSRVTETFELLHFAAWTPASPDG